MKCYGTKLIGAPTCYQPLTENWVVVSIALEFGNQYSFSTSVVTGALVHLSALFMLHVINDICVSSVSRASVLQSGP